MNRLNVLKNDTVETFIKIRVMRIPSCLSLSVQCIKLNTTATFEMRKREEYFFLEISVVVNDVQSFIISSDKRDAANVKSKELWFFLLLIYYLYFCAYKRHAYADTGRSIAQALLSLLVGCYIVV
jgi:hypothetical protein